MKRSKNRATRILALILMGMMCLGLAACGTVTEADSSIEAEAIEVEEEQVGATSLEVYFVLDEVTDEMTAYKINGGYYYISTEQAAAIAEELGEDFSFTDADGNVITITSDGSYSSDTGKALVKVVGVGDVFIDIEDTSLTVAVTEIVEEETEEETEEEIEEETEEATEKATEATTTASTSSSGDSSSSSGNSGSGSSSSSEDSSSSLDSDISDYLDNFVTYYITVEEETEEETEHVHSYYATYNIVKTFDHYEVTCYCGEFFSTEEEFQAHKDEINQLWFNREITAEECSEHSGWINHPVYTRTVYITYVCDCGDPYDGGTVDYETYLDMI